MITWQSCLLYVIWIFAYIMIYSIYISKLRQEFIEDRLDVSKKKLLFKDRGNEFSLKL